jgi:PhnB protein
MEHTQGSDFSLSLSGDDEAELHGYFEKLAAGGTVTMPLEKAPWGDTFGMLKDRFGVSWLVNISPAS